MGTTRIEIHLDASAAKLFEEWIKQLLMLEVDRLRIQNEQLKQDVELS